MSRAVAHLRALGERVGRDRHGGAALEMALVFPFMSLMFLGAIEAGWLLWSASTLDFAVEEAARCAAVDATNCATAANVQGVAVGKAMGLNMAASDFTVASSACGKRVSATYVFSFLMPFNTNFTVPIPAVSCFPSPAS